jgi:hypothetical protein
MIRKNSRLTENSQINRLFQEISVNSREVKSLLHIKSIHQPKPRRYLISITVLNQHGCSRPKSRMLREMGFLEEIINTQQKWCLWCFGILNINFSFKSIKISYFLYTLRDFYRWQFLALPFYRETDLFSSLY